jgi:hypothetical protein
MLYAFESLTNLTIPSSVESIGSNGIDIGNTTNKATIIFEPTTPPSIGSSWQKPFDINKINRILVPKGCANAYKTATNWTAYADYIYEIEIGA